MSAYLIEGAAEFLQGHLLVVLATIPLPGFDVIFVVLCKCVLVCVWVLTLGVGGVIDEAELGGAVVEADLFVLLAGEVELLVELAG